MKENIDSFIKYYNQAVDLYKQGISLVNSKNSVNTHVKWSDKLSNFLEKKKYIEYDNDAVKTAYIAPFIKSNIHYQYELLERARDWNSKIQQDNLIIVVNKVPAPTGNICLIVKNIIEYHMFGDNITFPLYIYENNINNIQRKDNITNKALTHFQQVYNDNLITKENIFYYVYGILHSTDYLKKYINNLTKEFPRIPRVKKYEQFKAFEIAGRELANIHLNYESVSMYDKCVIERLDNNPSYLVTKMKWITKKGKKDKTKLIYNHNIIISNIPLEAQEYIIHGKSALDWFIERACVSKDKKTDILNDFNSYAKDMNNDRYIFETFLRLITVSVETVRIVKALPKLEIHELDL